MVEFYFVEITLFMIKILIIIIFVLHAFIVL